MSKSPLLGASLLLVRDDGRLLAVTRRNSTELSFPGGKRDKNETSDINAIRETAEETGVYVPKSDLIHLYSADCDTDPVSGQIYFIDTFLAHFNHTMGYPVSMEEGIEVMWVTPEIFMEKTTFKTYNQAVIDAWKAQKTNPKLML